MQILIKVIIAQITYYILIKVIIRGIIPDPFLLLGGAQVKKRIKFLEKNLRRQIVKEIYQVKRVVIKIIIIEKNL